MGQCCSAAHGLFVSCTHSLGQTLLAPLPAGGSSSTGPNVRPPCSSLLSAGYASTTKGSIAGKSRWASRTHKLKGVEGHAVVAAAPGALPIITSNLSAPLRSFRRLRHRNGPQAAGRQQDRDERADGRR